MGGGGGGGVRPPPTPPLFFSEAVQSVLQSPRGVCRKSVQNVKNRFFPMKNQRQPKGNDRKSVQNVRKVGFFLEKTKIFDQKKKGKKKKYPKKNFTRFDDCT